jgi:hypothetical protein
MLGVDKLILFVIANDHVEVSLFVHLELLQYMNYFHEFSKEKLKYR